MAGAIANRRSYIDTNAIGSYIGRKTARAIIAAGAYVRKVARNSIKKARKPAEAGKPPRSHTGGLKNAIFFAFTPPNTVVIGPEFEPKESPTSAMPASGTVPSVLENSGEIVVPEVRTPAGWRRLTKKNIRASGERRMRRAHVNKHPYMGPALDASVKQGKIVEFWSATAAA